jgi:hypothetical protein
MKYILIIILTAAVFAHAENPGAVETLKSSLPPAIDFAPARLSPQSAGYVPRTKSVSGRIQKDPKPFFKSLAIPGWGQYSQQRKGAAFRSIGVEALLWGGMLGFRNYGNLLADDYKSYASSHAGIAAGGKDHQFFVDIGNYNSVGEYNERQEIERDWEALYQGENYYWQWDSAENMNVYEDIRVKSDLYRNSVIYFAGAIVVNHIVSAIDAARNTKSPDGVKAGVSINSEGKSMLTIIKGF